MSNLATLWTVAHQTPLSMGFSKQEYWSGLPFPSPGDPPDLGTRPGSPAVQETWVRSLGQEDALEKEMTIHCSVFAWKIPWTDEPGALQSMGSQRAGYNWAHTHGGPCGSRDGSVWVPRPYFMDTVAFTLIYAGCVVWPLALRAGSYSFRSHPRPWKGDIHLLRRHLHPMWSSLTPVHRGWRVPLLVAPRAYSLTFHEAGYPDGWECPVSLVAQSDS